MRFLGIDSELDRPRIQALRAAPPGLASSPGARRRVFGAALGQWDALLGASALVPAEAAPILIFYALAQAGRAVCAAFTPGQPWRPRGHGLRISDPGAPLGETIVSPDGTSDSAFAMLCRVLGSAPLSAPTTLGALWAANPQLESVDPLGGGYPPAIGLSIVSPGDAHPLPTRATLTGEIAAGLPEDPGEAAAELVRRLRAYPGVCDGLVVTGDARPQEYGLEWRDGGGELRPVEEIAPGLGGPESGAGFLWPGLGEEGDTLPALALWWATLLALSSLARYHPEQWRDALERDNATTAIPIEEALEVGREILPWLLLGTLERATSP